VSIEPYSPRHIAETQLETALRLYFEGADYFSVVTLAGAADEILGTLLTARGGLSALASLTKATVAIQETLSQEPLSEKEVADRANLARNVLKHVRGAGEKDQHLDIKEEAKDMLTRAIANYWELYQAQSSAMKRFEDGQRAA